MRLRLAATLPRGSMLLSRFMTMLLVLPIVVFVSSGSASADSLVAWGVNDSGLITVIDVTNGQGYLYNSVTSAFSPINVPGATSVYPYQINDLGQIVGAFTNGSGTFGFLDSGGTFTTIGVPGALQQPLGIGTGAVGINSAGEIVGVWSAPPSGIAQGFTYSGGSFTNTNISDSTSSLGGVAGTSLNGINDSGLVSGYVTKGQMIDNQIVEQGFVYNGSTFSPVIYPGAISTNVQDINNSGEVVGTYYLADGAYWGFTYNDGTFTTIMYPGSSSTSLYGISNDGEIVGQYVCASGACPLSDPAFFATPTATGYAFTTIPSSPTPEPDSLILLGSGVIAVLGTARRRILR
jgi:hypothetical protein